MATRTQSTVVAVFRNISDAQAAARDLKSEGFTDDDIYISSESGQVTSTTVPSEGAKHERGITSWFKRVFGGREHDFEDRPYYENAISSGNVLLSVDVDDEDVDRVADILEQHNPLSLDREEEVGRTTDYSTSAAAAGAAASRTTGSAAASAAATPPPAQQRTGAQTGQTNAIPVVEEQLKIGKRSILRGGVRVYSRVIEQPVEENINLREERVRVERQPVNRPVTDADLRDRQDETIEVKEYAEEPIVSKEARVVEEVRVSKDATERTQTVRDTVRRTEVNVENLNEQTSGHTTVDDLDADFRQNFATTHGTRGGTYEDYVPAYRYGYEIASDPRYRGRRFEDVETDLKGDYARRYPNSTWDRVKDSVRYGWDKVTGRTKAATR